MSQYLEEVTFFFQKYCDEYKRLFLPGQNDGAVADSLVSFYKKYHSLEVLEKSIKYYVENTNEPILIYNFAIESSKIREHIVSEMEIQENFNKLVQQTKERMERFK
jgi:hypothetical protein